MQPSAGHETPSVPLPHTRARPVHWLATGAALAAAVAAAALLRPSAAAASAAGGPAGPAFGAPDAAAAHYPMDCAGGPAVIVARAAADLDGDGRPDTAVVARCASQAGTPPSGIYVLTPGATPGARPRVTATLLSPSANLTATDLQIHGRTISATLWGYSSASVPRCCPDLRRSFSWNWRDGRFAAQAGPHANSV